MSCNCSDSKGLTESQKRNLARLLMEDEDLSDVDVEEGKMHDLPDVPQDENISDTYDSGEQLARDLVDATGDEQEASGMIAYAANIDPDDNIFDDALDAIDEIDFEEQVRVREAVRNAVRSVLNEETEFQQFTTGLIDKLGVDGLAGFTEDGKRKYFSFIEANWDETTDSIEDVDDEEIASHFEPDDFTGSAPDMVKEGLSETEIRSAVRITLRKMLS